MNDILEAFLATGASRSMTDLAGLVAELPARFGFRHVAVVNLRRLQAGLEGAVLANDWPGSWLARFCEPRHAGTNATMRFMHVSQHPFDWTDALQFFEGDPHYNGMQKAVEEASAAGLVCGRAFPFHARGGLEGFALVSARELGLSASNMLVLDTLLRAVHAQMALTDAERMRVEADRWPRRDITPREREVLLHMSDGLTSHEIGRLLSISRHTVDWYMSGLQEKFGARNRQHALAIALRSGTIS